VTGSGQRIASKVDDHGPRADCIEDNSLAHSEVSTFGVAELVFGVASGNGWCLSPPPLHIEPIEVNSIRLLRQRCSSAEAWEAFEVISTGVTAACATMRATTASRHDPCSLPAYSIDRSPLYLLATCEEIATLETTERSSLHNDRSRRVELFRIAPIFAKLRSLGTSGEASILV
jgi:hypothetical protein